MAVLRIKSVCIIMMCFTFVFSAALGGEDNKKSRVVDQKLSDEIHYSESEDHNLDYDHEAFLGEETARQFDSLSPEESLEGLSKIVDQIDKDADGFVSEEELRAWIEYSGQKYVKHDVDGQWKVHNPENKESISWPDYEKMVYGFMEGMSENEIESDEEGQSYADMKRRDQRRWSHADRDEDGLLTVAEFSDFLHPESSERMKDLVVTETVEDIDKNGDGKISPEEYIGDMWKGEVESEEPEWVSQERENFGKYRDLDQSGFMETNEVKEWIMPEDRDLSLSEAKHLISSSDDDGDGRLTKTEILDHYNVFVGSQATDFGEALDSAHDEF